MRLYDHSYHFLPPLNRDKRGGTVQHIQDAIRDAIVRIELPPGAFIDKTALCARLGVSRFPVSEALGRLADEGFVEVLPQRGTRVTRIDLADCREAMFIRRALEVETVRVIASRINDHLIASIERNIQDQQQAMKADDRLLFHDLDVELHDLLLENLGYERVKTAVYAARAKLDRMRLFMCTPQRQASTLVEHQEIGRALAARDPALVAHAMKHHLDMVMAEITSCSNIHPDAFETGMKDSQAA